MNLEATPIIDDPNHTSASENSENTEKKPLKPFLSEDTNPQGFDTGELDENGFRIVIPRPAYQETIEYVECDLCRGKGEKYFVNEGFRTCPKCHGSKTIPKR